jgi:hypothetical protein
MEELEIERTQLIYIRDQVLKQCMRCGGSGTVCEGRTGDDMPDYQVCPLPDRGGCGGKGNRR